MSAAYCYLDFIIRTFDIKGLTSRRCYWTVFGINAALSVLLTSIGVVMPQGRPLEIYIGISSVIATPLFIPFFTIIARRLSDAGLRRRWMLLALIPGLGMIPLFILCAFPSKTGTQEDFSAYRPGALVGAAKKFASSALTVFPFLCLAYSVYKLIVAADSFETGTSAAMLSINFVICLLTPIEAKTAKFKKFLAVWKCVKLLTALSSAILSILLYNDTQNFIDAFFTVYLYFYVMISPLILAWNVYKLLKRQRR